MSGRKDSACTGKRRFPSRKRAKGFYRKANIPGKDHLVPYKCEFCFQWHLGHLRPGNLLRVSSYNAFYGTET